MSADGGPWLAHRYDEAGNIVHRSVGPTAIDYQYNDLQRKSRLTHITINGGTHSYRYNDRGNMVEGPDLTDLEHVGRRIIDYSADGLPVTMTNTRTNRTVEMVYDGNGGRAAKVTRGEVRYDHPDRMGSTSAVTDATGRKIGSVEYMPFGTIREKTGSIEDDHRYTG